MNRKLISAAVVAALVPVGVQAAKVKVSISGQVNRAIAFADNGEDSDVLFVDNNNSGTRFRLRGSSEMNNGITVGVRWETQYQDNSSGAIDIGGSDNASQFKSRYRELWFSGKFGKVYLGQGDGAANGTSQADLSGTTVAEFSGSGTDLIGGLSFANAAGVKIIKAGKVFQDWDGFSRNDRIRYDTPKLGPVVLSADVGQDKFELAARLKHEFGNGARLAAAAGYAGGGGSAIVDANNFGGSASVLFNNGFNLTGAYATRDTDGGTSSDMFYVKGGYSFGKKRLHNLSVGYHQTDDRAADGDEARRFTGAYVLNLAEYGTELYIVGNFASLDRTGGDLEDLTAVHVGSRVKF